MSIESEGGEVDLRALEDARAAAGSGIPGAVELVELVEATRAVGRDEGSREAQAVRLEQARQALRAKLGSAALVDAAAVIGNFERMVRIADATGIPLDAPVRVAGESLADQIDLARFAEDGRWPEVATWQRLLGRVLQPLLRRVFRWRGRRAASSTSSTGIG